MRPHLPPLARPAAMPHRAGYDCARQQHSVGAEWISIDFLTDLYLLSASGLDLRVLPAVLVAAPGAVGASVALPAATVRGAQVQSPLAATLALVGAGCGGAVSALRMFV